MGIAQVAVAARENQIPMVMLVSRVDGRCLTFEDRRDPGDGAQTATQLDRPLANECGGEPLSAVWMPYPASAIKCGRLYGEVILRGSPIVSVAAFVRDTEALPYMSSATAGRDA